MSYWVEIRCDAPFESRRNCFSDHAYHTYEVPADDFTYLQGAAAALSNTALAQGWKRTRAPAGSAPTASGKQRSGSAMKDGLEYVAMILLVIVLLVMAVERRVRAIEAEVHAHVAFQCGAFYVFRAIGSDLPVHPGCAEFRRYEDEIEKAKPNP